jgi:hypothetical protein
MSRLIYNQRYDYLELDGTPVRKEDLLELYVMEYWLCGTVEKDASGWYLVTRDQVGIRLKAGLRARIPDIVLAITFQGNIESHFNHEKNT